MSASIPRGTAPQRLLDPRSQAASTPLVGLGAHVDLHPRLARDRVHRQAALHDADVDVGAARPRRRAARRPRTARAPRTAGRGRATSARPARGSDDVAGRRDAATVTTRVDAVALERDDRATRRARRARRGCRAGRRGPPRRRSPPAAPARRRRRARRAAAEADQGRERRRSCRRCPGPYSRPRSRRGRQRAGREHGVEVRRDDDRGPVAADPREHVAGVVASRLEAASHQQLGDRGRARLLGERRRGDRAQREGVADEVVEHGGAGRALPPRYAADSSRGAAIRVIAAQLVRRVERGDLVRLGQRRVVEHRLDEEVDAAAERHHGLADVDELGGVGAEHVHAEDAAVLGADEQLQHAVVSPRIAPRASSR